MNNDKNKVSEVSAPAVATVMPVRRAKREESVYNPPPKKPENKAALHREFSGSVPGARPGGNKYRDLGGFDRSLLVSGDVVRPPRRLG